MDGDGGSDCGALIFFGVNILDDCQAAFAIEKIHSLETLKFSLLTKSYSRSAFNWERAH